MTLRNGVEPAAFAAVDKTCFARGWSPQAFNTDPVYWGASFWQAESCTAFIYVSRIVDESELLRIACHPDQRGQGLAKALLEHYFEQVKAQQYFLDVSHTNHAAIALYQRYGYREIGQRRHYYGPDDHALMMQK